jgi:hypothetical protein
MQDSQDDTNTDLSGHDWEGWRARLHDVAGDDGFAEPLGERHAAVFIERKPVLLVTFESFAAIRAGTEPGEPMGWRMRDALGWSHLCIVCDGDTWFRDRHVFGFFDRLIDDGFFEEFDQVLFYGAGPCGYAAAAFSVASPGARVVALQPQATLDPRVAEWDDRFRHMRRTDFTGRFGYAPDMLDAAEQAYIVYDPDQALDAMHAALFTRPNVTKVRTRFFGSDVQTMLLRMGVLFRMLAQVSAGKFTLVNRARLLRGRQDSSEYQFNLLRHLRRSKRHGLVIRLSRKVLEQQDANPFRKAMKEAQQALGRQEDDGG